MKLHDLKSWPASFAAITELGCRAEMRYNDRDYQVGDLIELREWQPPDPATSTTTGTAGGYTGRWVLLVVKHVKAGGQFDIPDTHVLLTVEGAKIEKSSTRAWEDVVD